MSLLLNRGLVDSNHTQKLIPNWTVKRWDLKCPVRLVINLSFQSMHGHAKAKRIYCSVLLQQRSQGSGYSRNRSSHSAKGWESSYILINPDFIVISLNHIHGVLLNHIPDII